MRHLLYVSTSVGDVSADICPMLRIARRNNERNGVTGMLLYCEGHFLQLLEGEDDVVEATFARIKRNPRHRDVTVVLDEKVSRRVFAEWSMGFEQLENSTDPDAEAAFQISRMAIDRRIAAGNFWVVRRMMETFYEMSMRQGLIRAPFPVHTTREPARAAG